MSEDSSSSPAIYDFRDGISLAAALLLFIVGVFGLVTNSSIVYIFLKERSERTSFNLICVFRASSNVVILCTTFLFVFLPKTLLGFTPYSPALESCLIHLSLTLYLGNEYQIILVASNRFYALFLPTYYYLICGIIPTFIILVAIYFYRLITVIFEQRPLISKSCYTSFSTQTLAWIYDPNPDCMVEDNILQIIFFTFVAMTIINVITFLKIISFYSASRRNETIDEETKRRIRRNILLFFQTMLQDSLYLIDLTFTFKLSGLSNHRFWTFVCWTFVWECIHSVDGFIMMMFNERLSLLKTRFTTTPSSTLTRPPQISVSILPSVG